MENIVHFMKEFTNEKIGLIMNFKDKSYLINEQLAQIWNSIKIQPVSIGLYLGCVEKKEFVPSPALLDILSKVTDRKTVVNKKQEWFFTNHKDLAVKGTTTLTKGYVLVQNKFDQNLGLGLIEQNKVKNIVDVGDFLRREMDNE
jgi:ribosome biogenesis protein Nip4